MSPAEHATKHSVPLFRDGLIGRRQILGGILASLAGAVAVPARAEESDDALLARIAAYLNGIHTLRARFRQTAPDGQVTQGTVWLERPGHIRFQYDPPTPLLLVATNGEVIFQDFQVHQVSRIPLDRTPLSILLSDHIDFSGAVAVREISRTPGVIQLSVVRRTDPGAGLLAIVFSADPLKLIQWTVVDPQHKITRVELSNIQTGIPVDPTLFSPTLIKPPG
ncbi:LolA family protein [Granulibacter bethesdensis]|uniref:LolA family protein n=1 Tax=Granulibacter bethesdensis TaxID=364410 RepID=UPI0003F1E8EC|nr:outer membrane lipoprotein carrier protein LolA [Granulibacter bethesdensis]AHJ64992.1 Outer-membrane lipoproteins carrier protein [Granulibacter bethesdensis CGDNIH4]